ncbi:putative urate catabolism protein [Sphingobium sp. AP50]|uniref:allantoinase PuuE n=1 Tax=Sphingobium sp. AP50 TaxID=1884369 RepID=UPI0008B85149|nr:allantoinase PuuE [Sphingobium sp. AP50]SEJ27045.1 putative urate catabolism protein [Sphingobium sp. AP50]
MSQSRDLIGYGATPPDPRWPGGAKIAVQFVINYEEGAENSVLNGDKGSEAFLSEMVGAQSHPDRAMAMESLYEYGSRAGFWRLHRLFTQRGLPVTVFGVANAMAMNPDAVEAMLKADWEIASHGLKWIDYQYVPEDVERGHIAQAIALHEKLTGSRPLGWYQGRTSPNTARLVREEGGFVYDADSYADDLPYYAEGQLIVPYTLDANDMKIVALNGFTEGEQFFRYLRDTFDQLREEGGRMMSVGLHGRIAGRPGRARALARFLDHVTASGDAWIARRIDIARHWMEVHPL